MVKENQANALSWGISAGLHIVILMFVAATGLFQAVSSESHPVDVEIYDNVEENEEASDDMASSEASAAQAESVQPAEAVVIDQNVKLPEIEKENSPEKDKKEKADETKQETKTEAKPAAEASKDAKTGRQPAKSDGGSGAKENNKQGPARDPANVRHVKVRAQPLGGSQPSYPANLRAQNAAGSVSVSYVIEPDGSVSNPQVQASSGYPEMDAAAVNAILTFRYSPARNDYDEPVRSYGRYTFNFHP